jgi:hypothetical protein
MSKASRNRQRASEKIARMRAQEARKRRNQRLLAVAGAAVVAVAATVGIAFAATSGHSGPAAGNGSPQLSLAPLSTLGTLRPAPAPGPLGPEGVPVPGASQLASPGTHASGQPIRGISCQTSEQTLFHIHAHLTVFVNGSARQVPAGIGIPGARAQQTQQGTFVDSGNCFYWLHTHSSDGIVHIESPVKRTYTLGDFFAEWGQPLGPGQVGPAHGHVTAIYNGRVYRGDPARIPLTAHAQIQLEVGKPLLAPTSITWPKGL